MDEKMETAALKQELATAKHELAEARAYIRRRILAEADHARKIEESLARRRGAEAMREAAARELDRLLTEKKATAIWVSPDEIRALPIPEEP